MDVILSILLIYLLALPTGYIITRCLLGEDLKSYPPLLALIFSISIGLIGLVPMYYLIILVRLSIITPITFFILSVISIYLMRCGSSHMTSWKRWVLSNNLIPLLLFLPVFFYFVNTVDCKFWPPAGDIMMSHGPLVSLIEYNMKLPITFDPIAPEALMTYPPGMHVIVATLNTILNEYPARIVFLFGAAITILIPFLVYSFTYILTRSELFSIISLFVTFYIHHPQWHLATWVVGYFYNGPYANLFGFLIVLVYANIIALSIKQNKNSFNIKGTILGGILCILALLLVYPSFAVLILAHLFLLVIYYRSLFFEMLSKINKIYTNKIYAILLIFFTISLIYLLIAQLNIWERFWYILDKFVEPVNPVLGMYKQYLGRSISIEGYFILTHFFTIFLTMGIIIGLISSITLIILRIKYFSAASFYLIVAIPTLLSLIQDIYPYVFIILPRRSLIILQLLWLPLFFVIFTLLIKKYVRRIKSRPSISKLLIIVANIMILVIFLNIFTPYISGEVNNKLAAFSRLPSFSDDFEALQWIDRNVSSDELILSDLSFSSIYLISLSIKNSTYCRWSIVYRNERAKELWTVWEEPHDSQEVFKVIKKYNVSYILSTSEWGNLSEVGLGGDNKYHKKPFSPSEYARLFDTYPFLKKIFTKGNTRVYKVITKTNDVH